jgi:DNA primase
MPIPQHVIEQIRDRSDVVEVVGAYVDLKRAGTNYKGLCPFHQERTPSFIVSPDRQTYHCFGCGKGGNVFQFLMEMDGVSFPEAVRELGQRAGIEVQSRPDEEARSENDALFQANTFAGHFYHDSLVKTAAGEKARKYLEGRGIPREVWRRFGLGYSPGTGEALAQAALSHRVPREVLLKLKLVMARDGGRGYYDYFRDRLMFPIIQPTSRVVGFGGRILGDGEPKYLNSAESPLFQKRRMFYGLDRAHNAIRSGRFAYLVEGYTDLIRLHLAAVENSLATCGTAVTRDHAGRIRRLTRRVVLVPDGDAAGENAALISGALLMAEGVEVGVVSLPPGSDPDSAGKSMPANEFKEVLGRHVEYFAYLDYTIQHRNPTAREREELIRRIVGAISSADDPLRGDVLIGELARVVGVEPAGLRKLLRPSGGSADGDRRAGSDAGSNRSGAKRAALERLVLRLVMEGTPSALDTLDSLDVEDFSDEANRKLYKVLDSMREAHIDLRGRDYQRRVEETGLAGFANEISLVSVPPGNIDTLLKDHLRELKKRRIEDELEQLRERLLDLPTDSQESIQVAEYFKRLRQALEEL